MRFVNKNDTRALVHLSNNWRMCTVIGDTDVQIFMNCCKLSIYIALLKIDIAGFTIFKYILILTGNKKSAIYAGASTFICFDDRISEEVCWSL